MTHTDWTKLRVGDVLKSRSGLLRIVRHVTIGGPKQNRVSVVFTIKHCSWTGRGVTCYTGTDLDCAGYRAVNVRLRLRSKIDRAIAKAATLPLPKRFHHHAFTCCDAKGIS